MCRAVDSLSVPVALTKMTMSAPQMNVLNVQKWHAWQRTPCLEHEVDALPIEVLVRRFHHRRQVRIQ